MGENKEKPTGTVLAPSQDHAQWMRMVHREERVLGLDGREPLGGKLEAPFAAGGTFANRGTSNKRRLKLQLSKARPITGGTSTRTQRTSRTGRSTGRSSATSRTGMSATLLNTGRSSMFSINSSASNLTEIAMGRIDKLEQVKQNMSIQVFT